MAIQIDGNEPPSTTKQPGIENNEWEVRIVDEFPPLNANGLPHADLSKRHDFVLTGNVWSSRDRPIPNGNSEGLKDGRDKGEVNVQNIKGSMAEVLKRGQSGVGQSSLMLHMQNSEARSPRRKVYFFWGTVGEKRKLHWVSWRQICLPVDEGGLGIRRFREMAVAFGFKLW